MTNTTTATETAAKTHFALVRNNRVDGAWSLEDTEALDFTKKFAPRYAARGENVRIARITTEQYNAIQAQFDAIAADLKVLDTELETYRAATPNTWRGMDTFRAIKARITAKRDLVMKRYDAVRLSPA